MIPRIAWAVSVLVAAAAAVSQVVAATAGVVGSRSHYKHPPLPPHHYSKNNNDNNKDDNRYIDYEDLPNATLFPGPWEKYIKAPADKSRIVPARVWRVRGNVSTSEEEGVQIQSGDHVPGSGLLLGPGGILSLEFEENIGGRVCFDVESVGNNPVVQLAYSESPLFAGPLPDATTDKQDRDLPLPFAFGNRTGTVCVAPEFVRGAFKYLTISLPWSPAAAAPDTIHPQQQVVLEAGETYRNARRNDAWVSIASLWVNCTAFPSQTNGRAYSGYFYSSSEALNRIWYAGAWTLQLSTIDPREGSALIDYNRVVDGNHSPAGSWYCNFTIAAGRAVTTDGAKRDRMVWPRDMYIAVPAIAVSTHDMAAVRAALDVLFAHQYPDGSLPYAGPPMGFRGEFSDTYHLHTLLGVYNYVLFSGDVAWLRNRWPDYLRALNVSTAKVDALGLLHVSSTADWLRPGMTGHNLEASAMLHTVLGRSAELLVWLGNSSRNGNDSDSDSDSEETRLITEEWRALQRTLENGISRLYCPDTGLFADNVGKRHCNGSERVDPQDGNSWVLISKLDLNASALPWTDPKSPDGRANATLPAGTAPTARNMSSALRARWTAHGAPAPEFPNVISPFASGLELLAHASVTTTVTTMTSTAGGVDAAVELALLEWSHLLDGPGFTNSTLAEGFRVDGDPHYPAYASPARNSHAHGWAAGPTAVLVAHVLGIELLRPAGEAWAVRPALTKWLAWARGGFATARGRFEVKLWRALEVEVEGGAREGEGEGKGEGGRRAVMAEVTTPEGTRGSFSFKGGRAGVDVDDIGTGMRGSGDDFIVGGGGTRLWVLWEDENAVEELDVQDLDAASSDATDDWYRRRRVVTTTVRGAAAGGRSRELRFDETFRPPGMEARPVGVVDWEAMPGFFDTPSPFSLLTGQVVDDVVVGREDDL